MARNGNRGSRPQRRRYDPNIYLSEIITVNTANAAVNNTLYTNPDANPVSFRLQKTCFSVNPGDTSTPLWFVIRRVAQGYVAPTTVTVATGTTTFIDQRDVLGYAFIYVITGTNTTYNFDLKMLRPTVTLYEGDFVVIQAVTSVSSAGQGYSVISEFGTSYR